MAHFVVTAVGADRPGIVAAVTGVLVETGCNVEDASMTILRGRFAMVLVIRAPDDLPADALEAALVAPAAAYGLAVTVSGLDEVVPESPPGERWTVSVYGADRPGIVHRVTSVLAAAGVNVVDLTTRVIGDPDRPVYAMLLDVTLPAGADGAELAEEVGGVAAELGVECSLHPADADIL